MVLPTEIGLIILFAIVGSVIAVRFKQPAVLGLLVIGALVGPNALGMIKDQHGIELAIEIGAILLMFTIGIEFSIPRLLSLGLRVILIALIKIGITFLTSYYVSILFGMSKMASLYMGVIMSITSTVILVKILEQKGLFGKEEMPMIITVLIIEDLYGIFALTFFSGLNSSADLAPLHLLFSIFVSLALLVFTYFILQGVIKHVVRWLIKYSSEDTFILVSIGLCLGMSFLSMMLKLSPSVGAFLAGNIVSSLPNSKSFEKAIHPFTLVFTSLFFFSMGTTINFQAVLKTLPFSSVMIIVLFVGILVSVGIGSYLLMNFNGRSAIFSSLAMIPIGEFSLLIANESKAVNLGIDLISITSSIILLSAVIMSLTVARYDKAYSFIRSVLPTRTTDKIRQIPYFIATLSKHFDTNLLRRDILKDWRQITFDLTRIIMVSAIAYFVWHFLSRYLQVSIVYPILFVIIAIIIIFFPLIGLIKDSNKLICDCLDFMSNATAKGISEEKKAATSILIITVCSLLIILLPFFSNLISLSYFEFPIALILLFLVIAFSIYSAKLFSRVVLKKPVNASRKN